MVEVTVTEPFWGIRTTRRSARIPVSRRAALATKSRSLMCRSGPHYVWQRFQRCAPLIHELETDKKPRSWIQEPDLQNCDEVAARTRRKA